MKDHNPHDPVNIIGEAYELFLERTMHDTHALSKANTRKSPQPIYRILNRSDKHNETSHWIENKKYLIKNIALDYLKHAGDKTTVALRRLNHSQKTADKHATNENILVDKLHQPRNSQTIRHSLKTDTHQYKKCNNKAFRRLQ